MIIAFDTADPIVEAPRAMWRRRLQQKKCLVCGSRDLHNRATSYFCTRHLASHRYCSTCETLRSAEEHGRDSRCKACAGARALATYYADPDRTRYRIRLRQIARRRHSRHDMVFIALRKQIALAAFVAATPGWSWVRRAAYLGVNKTELSADYRRQSA